MYFSMETPCFKVIENVQNSNVPSTYQACMDQVVIDEFSVVVNMSSIRSCGQRLYVSMFQFLELLPWDVCGRFHDCSL